MEPVIRHATSQDGEAIARIYNSFIAGSPVTFEEKTIDGTEMSRRIEETQTRYPFLVAQAGGEVIGYAYAAAYAVRAAYRWSVTVTVYIDPGHHRKGVGRALYSQLFPLLKKQGFVQMYAGITLPNDKSVGLHESLGFRRVGIYRNVGYKLGAWRDVGWWEKSLNEAMAKPAEPSAWRL